MIWGIIHQCCRVNQVTDGKKPRDKDRVGIVT